MDFVGFFDGSGCTFSNKPEALDSNECAQQSQKSSQRWCERERETERERERVRGMWIDGIQQPNDREAKTALPLSALIVG